MLVGLVSAKGSPGVTVSTLALAAAWPRTCVMIEADPFGGDVRAGLGRGEWPRSTGLAELVVDLRSREPAEALARQSHRHGAHSPAVVAGLADVGQAATVPWDRVTAALQAVPCDVVADCGRFTPTGGVVELLARCDALVVVSGSSLPMSRATSRLAPMLLTGLGVPAEDPRVSLLVVAAGRPYTAAEIASGCRLRLLGDLPHDRRAAAVWTEGAAPPRRFPRSALQQAACAVAKRLAESDTGRRSAA